MSGVLACLYACVPSRGRHARTREHRQCIVVRYCPVVVCGARWFLLALVPAPVLALVGQRWFPVWYPQDRNVQTLRERQDCTVLAGVQRCSEIP